MRPRQAAHLRSSSRTTHACKSPISAAADLAVTPSTPARIASNTSLSAAAELVVKPPTPPRMVSGEVQADRLADCSAMMMNMTAPISNVTVSGRYHAANNLVNLASNYSVQHAADQGARFSRAQSRRNSRAAVEKPNCQVPVEVRRLSGESLLNGDFALSDRVISVRERVSSAWNVPHWQQVLTLRGEILNDQSRLGELSLQEDGAVFEMVLRAGLMSEDMETLAHAIDNLEDNIEAFKKSLNERDIDDACNMGFHRPPQRCEDVCLAAIHLLAGEAEATMYAWRKGRPKYADWERYKAMLSNADFLQQLSRLPSDIDDGKLMKNRMVKCRQHIHALPGNSEAEKLTNVGPRSTGTMYDGPRSRICQQLANFLIAVSKYYDIAAEFRERFGATICELRAQQ